MGILRSIALAILVLSLVVFLALFGRLPSLRATPIGFLHRSVWIHMPKAFRKLDNSLTGGRISSSINRFVHHLLYEKHPIVLIFFLTVLTGPSALFIYSAWSRLSPFPHHLLIPVILPLPYLFTYLSARSQASYITPRTHATQLRAYPFDHILYHPNNLCTTCTFEKPARSKHCSICRACIARADHHCVWVNNCLGAANYRYFVALLASLAVTLTYGAALAYSLLAQSPIFAFDDPGRHGRGIYRHRTTPSLRARFAARADVWARALQLDLNVGAVGLLALLTAPLAWTLLAYHVYLVWAGMTTNETGKWADLREDMADGMVWRQRWGLDDDGGGPQERAANSYADAAWPVRRQQRVLTTRLAKEEPPLQADSCEEAWERCWSLGDLDNLYDVGLWHNLKDALNMR